MEEQDLEDIKREIVECRSLSIKTNNLVSALGADLKSIAKRQQGYQRHIVVNSATAYVVTVGVLFVALKFAWDARVDSVRAEGKQTRERLAQADKELARYEQEEEQRIKAGRRAHELYELIQENKRRELLEEYPKVAKLPLTRTEQALLSDAVRRARNELSLIAYQTGLDHIRTRRYHDAELSFRESLEFKRDAAHSPQATYQLGIALRALGKQRDAIPMLMQLSEASADREVMDEAAFLLAQCQIDIQAWNDAKNTLRTFLRRFPKSQHVNEVRVKLSELQLYH